LLNRFKQRREFSAAGFQGLGAKWKILLHSRGGIMSRLVNRAFHCLGKHVTHSLDRKCPLQKIYVWLLPTVVMWVPLKFPEARGACSTVWSPRAGVSFSGYIKHEMHCTAATARPTVSRDHHAVHTRSTSGGRTPYVVSALNQRYGLALDP
jgi:hypothetical protein